MTGGALKPDNPKIFFWYLVKYKWKNGISSYDDPDENVFNIVVEDSAGVPHTIATKGADAAEKTLGLITCPFGKMDAQKDVIIDKCNEWIG